MNNDAYQYLEVQEEIFDVLILSHLLEHLEDPQEFLIAGADKIFYEATARIVDNEIILSCPKVPIPEAIRYAWKNSPDVNTFNKEGLPMIPFRTDNWKGITKNED